MSFYPSNEKLSYNDLKDKPTMVTSVIGGTGLDGGTITESGTLSVKYGTASGTACQGNDSRLSDSRTPTSHASTGTGYGVGDATNYGHVKLSDVYTSSVGTASNSIGASQSSVYNAHEHNLIREATYNVTFSGGVGTITGAGGDVKRVVSVYNTDDNAMFIGRIWWSATDLYVFAWTWNGTSMLVAEGEHSITIKYANH